MTPLQVEALQRAKRGDWQLADAMELEARAKDWVDDLPLSHGLLENGRLRYLVWAEIEYTVCDECDGTGEVECSECSHVVACTECDGDGNLENDEFDADQVITNLDGDRIEEAGGQTFYMAAAKAVLAAYHDSIKEGAFEAAPSVPNTTQIPLIQESAQCM